ncbi:hypothetical protein JOF53_001893 [Crossiella equi]|uniref:Uncharacterized protein n=1 Tax=Crossiella equi TaxID=130796 RepID=A0ABS5A8X4_9PSEU|nr:hypothetical protein [Crossiella equi]MBP2473021.1 hypothetical protein [Crossiella equi]
MTTETESRFIRLNVELIVELTDFEELKKGALEQLNADTEITDEARAEAIASLEGDPADALSYFIDPFAVVNEAPGIDLVEVGWDGEVTDYDPDAEDEGDED